jgi:hypothetical protein
MFASVQQFMRYWSFLVAKLFAAGAIITGLLWSVNRFWTPRTPLFHINNYQFGYDLPYTALAGVIFLLGIGLVYLCILDQRYRCRVCLRRLRMPILTGSWSKMLQLGRPKTEYICLYGHGKLNISELHISGIENPEWTEHADYWAELCGTGKNGRDFPE